MLTDFFKDGKHNYSHTRLISIIGSFCVFGMFLYMPTNDGIQNLMTILLTGSLVNATASKFADIRYVRKYKIDDPDDEDNKYERRRKNPS